ncbi:MAG: class I SAM-dependent methyltransferase [Deltaproteobacteria bacterium]|nr:class I SAM-dependent methyltransferase [Deltaproteobacteria bacterium]
MSTSPQPQEAAACGFNTLGMFLSRLARGGRSEILDLGPVSGRSIEFLAGQSGFRVRVEDLCRQAKKGFSLELVEAIELPQGFFDGVFLWNLLDCFTPAPGRRLVERLFAALKPGGLILAFFDRFSGPGKAKQFNLLGPEGVLVREMDSGADFRSLANREVMECFGAFDVLSSFVLKSGLREFLFRRPYAVAWPRDPG